MSDDTSDRSARLAQGLVDAPPDALLALSAAGDGYIIKPIDTRTRAAMSAARLERAAP